MSSLASRLSAFSPQVLAILRVITALLFIAHGTGKLFGFPDTGMSPPLFSLFGFAAVLEVVGGILIVLGLFTRPVAFILAGEMAVAYFMAHAPHSFFPIINQGEIGGAVLLCLLLPGLCRPRRLEPRQPQRVRRVFVAARIERSLSASQRSVPEPCSAGRSGLSA